MAFEDYVELDMTGMNVDHARGSRSILSASYGDGFRDTTRVGAVGGTHEFQLSAGAWSDDDSLLPIGSESWMEYYTNFFDERLDNANEPFIIDWRGRKWLVDMAETSHGVETHTSDLFTPDGITLRTRRVRGLTFCLDGSVFDPSLLEPYTWGRYKDAQDFPTSTPGPVGDAWVDSITGDINGDNRLGVFGTDVVSAADVLGTHDAVRFSGTTNNGVLTTTENVTIYDAWFVMKMREATFSNIAGILTGDVAPNNVALVGGGSGITHFFNLGIGSSYSYEKNNVSFPESNQQAPMNTFGVVHARFGNGVALTNLQVGADRDFAGRFAEMDQIEMNLCNVAVPYYWAEAFNRWLMTYYGIS